MYTYKGYIDRVVDGDTYDVTIDLGFRMNIKLRVRLKDTDTPETWRPRNEAEEKHGEQATKFVKDTIENKTVFVKTYKEGIYNRWAASIILMDGTDLGDLLRAKDLVKRDSYHE